MRECVAQWANELRGFVALERGGKRFKDVLRPGEYINVVGHDSSILEVVLDRGVEKPYCSNVYTRVVWSERNPIKTPFAFSRYFYVPSLEWGPGADPGKPKQAFYNDKECLCKFLSAEEAVEKLFGTFPPSKLLLKGYLLSFLNPAPML